MPDSLLSDTREGLVDRVFEAIDNRNDVDVSLRDLAEAVVDDFGLVNIMAALVQVRTVCADNDAPACDHRLALKFIDDVARAALEKANG